MPFYHFYNESDVDDESDLADPEMRPTGAFEYEETSARFSPKDLKGVAATAFELFRVAGVSAMRVLYDGGNDEGFAHPDDVWINGQRLSLHDVTHALVVDSNVEAIRSAVELPGGSFWGNGSAYYRQLTPEQAVAAAIEELANEIAIQLLGRGYGNGEYELYGAVTVDFATGQMMDDPNAERPLDRM